ncbi:MAG: hypothetical protein PHH84_04420 [Oscillospiraceae bacterium]|nr:hypothetical protein [Oscillospiraceae bacterium]MDD4414174.1 hypothetical protein [Oscillospiraceae bacterium]
MTTLRKTIAIIFLALSLPMCYILAGSALYQMLRIISPPPSIGIIGGVDINISLLPLSKTVIHIIIAFLAFLAFLAFNICNMVFAFRKKKSQKMQIGLIIWLILIALLFVFIPSQALAVSAWALFRPYSSIHIIYVWIILGIYIAQIFALIPFKRKESCDESI